MTPDWIPSRSTAKGRLVLAALQAFGERGFEAVKVGELATAAETTTGPLYHHFGSKLGLYTFVREDVEKRIVERMQGALAVTIHDDVTAALVVAYDYATRAGFARMLSEPTSPDPVARLLSEHVGAPLGAMLTAAWRAALASDEDAREALRALRPAAARPAPLRSPARSG